MGKKGRRKRRMWRRRSVSADIAWAVPTKRTVP